MLSFLIFIVLVALNHNSDAQILLPTPNLGGSMGCVVSDLPEISCSSDRSILDLSTVMIRSQLIKANQLYSHGNYIRDLNNTEIAQVQEYKQKMATFQKNFEEALKNAFFLSQNGSLPVIPKRPPVPEFCFANDTVLFVFAGCTVQNYKLYVGQKFARELTSSERADLDKFAKQMVSMPNPNAQNPKEASTTVMSETSKKTPAPEIPPSLEFCIEFQ